MAALNEMLADEESAANESRAGTGPFQGIWIVSEIRKLVFWGGLALCAGFPLRLERLAPGGRIACPAVWRV